MPDAAVMKKNSKVKLIKTFMVRIQIYKELVVNGKVKYTSLVIQHQELKTTNMVLVLTQGKILMIRNRWLN